MGIRFFAVSNLEEALSLRRKGITGDILILGPTPYRRAKELARYGISQTVYSSEYARDLSHAASDAGVSVRGGRMGAGYASVKTDPGQLSFALEKVHEYIFE